MNQPAGAAVSAAQAVEAAPRPDGSLECREIGPPSRQDLEAQALQGMLTCWGFPDVDTTDEDDAFGTLIHAAVSMKAMRQGHKVEFRWGRQKKWYPCCVHSVDGEGRCKVVELEFLGPNNARAKRGKVLSEKEDLVQLLRDGDIATPGKHLHWG